MNGIIIQQEVVYKTDRGTPVTDSLKVAEVFGKRHDNVLKSIRNICRPQNVGEQTEQSKWFYESSYIDANGAKRPMFVMNRDGFSLLAMGLTGAKAMQFKVGFIEQFNAMETVVHQVMQTTPAIPQTFAEALRLAASQAEQIEQQQKKIEADAPRVLFSQAVETSNKSVLIGELAKIICQNGVNTGEKRLLLGCVKKVTCANLVRDTTNRPKRQWKWACLKSRKQRFKSRMDARLFPTPPK